MPKLRGDQLAQKLYDIDNDIKIIFVSGYSEVVEAVKKLDISILGVFLKPVSPEIIEKIVSAKTYSDQDPYPCDLQALNVYQNI